MLAERLLGLRSLLAFSPFAADPDAELRRLLDRAIPAGLPAIEAWPSRQANLEAGFAVGRRRTCVDLALVDTRRWILEHEPRALEAFPALARLRAATDDDPRVARLYASDRHCPPPDRADVEMMKRAMGA